MSTLRYAIAGLMLSSSYAMAALPENNTVPLQQTTPNFKAEPKPEAEPPLACIMPPLETHLSAEVVTNIDAFLAGFKQWLVRNDLLHPAQPEDFFGERDIHDEEIEVYERFIAIFDLEGYYEPGTKEGLALMLGRPELAKEIMQTYAEHADAQKYMLDYLTDPEVQKSLQVRDRLRVNLLHQQFSHHFADTMMGILDITARQSEQQRAWRAANNCPNTPQVSGP